MISLAVGAVLEWISNDDTLHDLWRVLWLEPQTNQIVLFNLQTKAMPSPLNLAQIMEEIANGQVQVTVLSTQKLYKTEDEIPDTYKEIRDKNWEMIRDIVSGENEPLIYNNRWRGRLVREVHERTHTSRSDIYRLLKEYWYWGKTKNGLLPNYHMSGAPGKRRTVKDGVKLGRPSLKALYDPELQGVNVTDDDRRIFAQAISLYYHTPEQLTFEKVYVKMCEKWYHQGYEMDGEDRIPILLPPEERPTLRQFQYWYNSGRDFKKEISSRQGQRTFNLKFRELLGKADRLAFGPGSVWQIDATVGDIFLVHRVNRAWLIGRPVIYFIIDVFSRYICGLYVGLEGPSWLGAMMALMNAGMDKVAYCAKHGIDIDKSQWLVSNLPSAIVADRGELLSTKANNLINGLGVSISNLPPFRPDWKPFIEQSFRTSNDYSVRFLPGAIPHRFRERGDRDYRLDGKLTADEFEQVLIRFVLYYNNNHVLNEYDRDLFMVANNVNPIAGALWNWGIQHRSGRLLSVAEDVLQLNLLPSDNARVTAKGISFDSRFYTCPQAENWFRQVRATKKTWTVTISHDPRNLRQVYLRSSDGRRYETCTLTDPDERTAGLWLEEAQDLRAYEAFLKREHTNSIGIQSRVELDAHIEGIAARATEQTDNSLSDGESNSKRLNNIRVHRMDEKIARGAEEAVVLAQESQPAQGDNVIQFVQPANAPGAQPRKNRGVANYKDKIKQLSGKDQ